MTDYVRGPQVAQEVPQRANVAYSRGLLVFSTNGQKFKLDRGGSERYDMQDISAGAVPGDFARNPRSHRCYKIRKRGES